MKSVRFWTGVLMILSFMRASRLDSLLVKSLLRVNAHGMSTVALPLSDLLSYLSIIKEFFPLYFLLGY